MKHEPLKDKEFYGNGKAYLGAFARDDVKSAVEYLKESWKHQCECMFGADWNEAKDFKIFYKDFLEEIDKSFPDLNTRN